MKGFQFSKFIPEEGGNASFDKMMKIFTQLITYTSGDASDALSWMTELDGQYGISDASYGMGDFVEDLKNKGFITEENPDGSFDITPKTEQSIRKSSLEEIFGKLKKGGKGNHRTPHVGTGSEFSSDIKPYQFGDSFEDIDIGRSIHNAQVNHGIDSFRLTQDDLEVREREHASSCATVLMIDISHSMILYGEDRITPAKKVAMALSELVSIKYPKDSLDIIVFGNDAWPIEKKELPYLKVGPFHTNTYAGLELAVEILRKKKTGNKQIFMITDGKPTCLKQANGYYKNSFGLDPKVINKVLNMASQCKRLQIPITTFMIARDPYLQQFVRRFTETNGGRAYYSSLDGLGEFIFEDFIRNRKKRFK